MILSIHLHLFQIASHNGALTVLNPGTHPNEAYFAVAGIHYDLEFMMHEMENL